MMNSGAKGQFAGPSVEFHEADDSMNTVAQSLDLAVRFHQTGNLQQAELAYRQILQVDPENVNALHLLGLIALQMGKLELAVEHISQAVRLKPDFAEARGNLGIALQRQGKPAQALANWRQALVLKPNYPEAHNYLGIALAEQGSLDQAIASWRQAIRWKPDYAEAYNNLGVALQTQGLLDEAMANWRQAICIEPDYADAHQNLASALKQQGKLDEAVASYRQTLRFKPDFAEAHLDLGNALKQQGKLEEAVASYRQAIRLKPDFVGAIYNLGNALKEQGKLEEAVTSYQQALHLKPDYSEAHNNLGIAWLLLGNFEQGWPEYEWRYKSKELTPRSFSQPLWDGSPLEGRTILLHMEQGWGDTLQFIRYASLIKSTGGRVALACPLSLVNLLSSCAGIDWFPSETSPLPEFDVHAPLLSLPGILKTSLTTIPANVPYLFADPQLIDHWRRELGEPSALKKIGIAWQGNPTYLLDHQRSIPLAHFAPLARLAGVKLFSLQKGLGREQLDAVKDQMDVVDLGSRLDQSGATFADTAAVMKNLDLIVTSDTAIAHLAGALGIPVWIALAFVPDWRWLLHREDCPWYPTMRLFRQPAPGNWQAVFLRIAAELRAHFGKQQARLSASRSVNQRDVSPSIDAQSLDLAFNYHRTGNIEQAKQIYRQILQIDPENVNALHLFGVLALQEGRTDLAVDYISQALRLAPNFAEAHDNLGIALREQGRLEEAVASCRQALSYKPDYAEAHNNLGIALRKQGRLLEAVASCRQALTYKPDYAEAHLNLGDSLYAQGNMKAASESCREVLRLQPDLAGGYNLLGLVFWAQGKLEESLASYRQATRLRPNSAIAHDNLLYAMQYCPGMTLADLAEAHAEYQRQHAAPLRSAWKPHDNVRESGKKLRLGLISADFSAHPVGYFLIRALESLDRSEAEIVCYSNRPLADAMTGRFQATAAIWRDVVGLSDAQLAEQVRADRIDILFDLAGHTDGNRLLVFARKPAPIQISWIGYEGTTGLTAIDYILADRHVLPFGSEPHYVEQVLRMPHGYLCYDPPAMAPPVGSLPALTNGFTTFGSFNNLAKISPQVVDVWAKILRSVPQSRLILQSRGLGDRTVKDRYTALFTERGVDSRRLDLRAATAYADYLAGYREVDIALDPFPFAGSTITCEALWMGVPVVTCPGETFASRHTLSHLSNIGITEIIASDLDEYVGIAAALARDLPRLATLRAGLRPRMAASPLCDGKQFAMDLAALLRVAWRKYCA
jgi:predicted O-linked N-acetylglucosamine transferase (SPINDLY family)